MNLLLFSDLHRDRTATGRIVELSRDADVVVGAGDFATVRRGLHDTLDVLAAIDKPAVLVPGNAESFEELQAGCAGWPSAVVLHGTGREIDGVPFWGLGGAVPTTPFGPWSYDFTEAQATELLRDCPIGGVLVTHSPPKGLLDRSSAGKSLGSTAVREAVERCRPRLVVCGHIHDRSGRTDRHGETTVINAGPRGMWFELVVLRADDRSTP
jgi:Icc-related predicted phosphoesterase